MNRATRAVRRHRRSVSSDASSRRRRSSTLRLAATGTGCCCALATVPATYVYLSADEGTKRALAMYLTFGPVVLHYRAVEARQKWRGLSREMAAKEWAAMDSRYAEPTVKKLGEMQGMYVKYGQTAAGFTDTFSKTWIAQFRTLEDQVPARSSAVVYRTIEEETGRPWDELFSEFDETPLGSASIGQVHRARLRSNGAEVAVKVQYPEVRDLFRTDMAAIRSFLGFASPKHLFTIGQLEKQLGPECDYVQEARNLQEVAANMTKHGFMPREVVVPRPYLDLSTSRMLVMELLPGPKLSQGLREYMQLRALREGKTVEELGNELRRRAESGESESRYRGPSATQIDVHDALVAWRDWLLNLGVAVLRVTPLIGLSTLDYYQTVWTPNIPRMVDTLMRVHGAQLMWDGVLNVDPHAGNFLLLDDKLGGAGVVGGCRSGSRANGRIGLIDYGATHRLTREERLIAAITYAALGRRDEDLLQIICEESGYKSKVSGKLAAPPCSCLPEVIVKRGCNAVEQKGSNAQDDAVFIRFFLSRGDGWALGDRIFRQARRRGSVVIVD